MHQVEEGESTEYFEGSDTEAPKEDQVNTVDRGAYDPTEYLYPITEVHNVGKPVAVTGVLLENAENG